MKTSEVLDKAADLIERRGWIKGTGWPMAGGPEDAALCLEGGIAAAMGMRFAACIDDAEVAPLVTCPAYTAVVAYLDDALPTYGDGRTQPLWWWNDRIVTKGAEQVIATLRAAAVIEAARESESATTTSPTPAEVSL